MRKKQRKCFHSGRIEINNLVVQCASIRDKFKCLLISSVNLNCIPDSSSVRPCHIYDRSSNHPMGTDIFKQKRIEQLFLDLTHIFASSKVIWLHS